MSVHDHPHALQRDQPLADHAVEDRQKLGDTLRLVHDLDDHGQVLGQTEYFGGMDATARSETERATQDGGAGEPSLARLFHDDLIKRTPEVLVAFTDEDADELCFGWKFHVISLYSRLPMASPTNMQTSPRTTWPMIFAPAENHCASRKNSAV